MTANLNSYLFVGAVLFVCGVVCMATKRNGIGVLMGVELVLNGAPNAQLLTCHAHALCWFRRDIRTALTSRWIAPITVI